MILKRPKNRMAKAENEAPQSPRSRFIFFEPPSDRPPFACREDSMSYKVILIDDEPLIVKGFLKRIDWEGLGFHVSDVFSDPNAALEYFRTDSADLAILDIRMPEMSGVELMRKIGRISRCRFLVISGYSEFEYAQAALQSGALDYLVKPVANHILSAAVIAARQTLDRAYEYRTSRLRQALRGEGEGFDEAFWRSRDVFCMPRAFCCAASTQESVVCGAPETRIVPLFSESGVWFFLVCFYGAAARPEDGPQACFSGLYTKPEELGEAVAALRDAGWFSFLTYLPAQSADEARLKTFAASLRLSLPARDWESASSLLCGLAHYFENLFNEICALLTGDPPHFPARLSAQQIAAAHATIDGAQAFLQRALVDRARQEKSALSNRQIVQAIVTDIRRNYHTELSLHSYADQYYLSMSYLSTLFKNETGESFISFFTRVRMENSANLLAASRLAIEQVSHACGYRDVSYFNRVFKKYFGVTPAVYRARQRRQEDAT